MASRLILVFYTLLYLLVVSTCLPSRSIQMNQKKGRPPVILVPGDGGSQIEAKLDKRSAVHFWCDKKSDWYSLWINMEEMAPYIIECSMDNMRLLYDAKTRTTSNNVGVETREPGFGNTSTVEWLDTSHFIDTDYFYNLVEVLVAEGYTRNVDIRGAPYDFRKAANEMGNFYNDLKMLVETTYKENNNQKVVLLAHSLGNLHVLYFLNRQAQSWKDTYIHSFISLAGPWGGAVKSMRLMASGDHLDFFWVNPEEVWSMEKSMTSTAWLMPHDTFWNKDDILVQTPRRNYTVSDYKAFFADLKYTNGLLMREDTENLTKELVPPGVEVHCIHGTDCDTPEVYNYKSFGEKDNPSPDITNGPGDGTVNLRSLLGCLQWEGKQNSPVYHQSFSSIDHMGILKTQEPINYIKKILLK